MNIVYEPRGRAFEYSPLACNLYMGCPHGCKYCYAPGCMRKTADEWHTKSYPRKDAIALFEKDAELLRGDTRKILFCFLSDPYQELERRLHLTRKALEICANNRLKSQILTKGCSDLIREDFNLMKRARTELGITLCFSEDESREEWEPNASTVQERLDVLKDAHAAGIYTWVSLEPVIIPQQALRVIELAAPYVNFWKVGKINHMKIVEDSIDWHQFRKEVEALLNKYNAKFYIKESLQRY